MTDVFERQETVVLILEIAYSNLYRAYMSGDDMAMIKAYENAYEINIPCLQNKIHDETKSIFYEKGIRSIDEISIRHLPHDQLELNVVGCLNALQKELSQRNFYRNHYTYAQTILYQSNHVFSQEEVLYRDNRGNELKVADFLSVSKYAIGVAEAIDPSNENYVKASAVITTLQGIDAVLNNKPEDKPVNKMLHLATSFISSVVKSAQKTDEAKRNVTVTALLIDLVIDFLCKK